VGFSYDTASRRSTLTLSNGVNMSYTYDNDSRVTGITYKFNANTLGNLTYSYDSLGRRTQVGGSLAQTGLPGTVASATYDAANELTNWNGTPINYDLNGNMLSDGTNAFSWNARNQVATLNSVSLQYDGFGRRTKNLQNTSFLFDGANAVQELSGSTATANLISGGIDEIFTRTDSGGAFTPLEASELMTNINRIPLGEVMAERELKAVRDGKSQVAIVRIGKPIKSVDATDFRCPYQVAGIGDDVIRSASGEDSMQALQLAIKMVGTELHFRYKDFTFTWLGNSDLGFAEPDHRKQ